MAIEKTRSNVMMYAEHALASIVHTATERE